MSFYRSEPFLKLNRRIRETNVLTKFHEDWAKIENCPPPGGHVFSPIMTIFELVRDIYKIDTCFFTNPNVFQTQPTYPGNKCSDKVHEDLTTNVTSRVFTCFHYIHREKTAPPPGGHVFSPIWTIFELVRDIN
ncbi:hypothetical protein DPMN_007039 [Dreissena polymorpha]|uniref:Uncharacterized protein n=1 Tax=Dreissena polymorpha TaxID=45954 RepID=A0A9D4MWL5_DREPO|nr:hypothetical protein DPMN_007039 [Dreissena polymorpha]